MPKAETEAEVVAQLRAAGCVFAEDEARLLIEAAHSPSDLAAMVAQRVSGLPLEPILGWVDFFGLRLKVAHGVFVPRRRSEFLAASAIAVARPGAVVVDLCCGCGALAAAVASAVRQVEVYAADVEPAAVACAAANLESYAGQTFTGDLYSALPSSLLGRVDVLIVNAPYVPTDRIALMPPEARDHEPTNALDGGADGLDVQRRVVGGAVDWLAPGGVLLIESSDRQAPTLAGLMADSGLTASILTDHDLGATVVLGAAELGDV